MITLEEMNKIFSENPSVRLKESLIAMDKFDSMENCSVEMGEFFSKSFFEENKPTYFACLAGASAIIRFNLNIKEVENLSPDLDPRLNPVLAYPVKDDITLTQRFANYQDSINFAKSGIVSQFLGCMGIEEEDFMNVNNCGPSDYDSFIENCPKIEDYCENQKKWREDIENLVVYLQENNL